MLAVLKHFANPQQHSLSSVLDPSMWDFLNHDFVLPWVAHTLSITIARSHQSENNPKDLAWYQFSLHEAASYLEARGLWYWAIFVLQHQRLAEIRHNSILAVLARNALSLHDTILVHDGCHQTAASFLKENLQISNALLSNAMVSACSYNNDFPSLANHAWESGQHDLLQTVMVEKLALSGVLDQDPAAASSLQINLQRLKQNQSLVNPRLELLWVYYFGLDDFNDPPTQLLRFSRISSDWAKSNKDTRIRYCIDLVVYL